MLEILLIVFFFWLFFKALGLTFKLAWGITKVLASILFAVALPLLGLGIVLASGLLLLIPVALVAAAVVLLKAAA